MRHSLPLLAVLSLVLTAPALAQPADVTRVLRTFDFEERRLGNAEDLPMRWIKVQGPGLPHYVNGRLTTDSAHGGRYSFRFDLDGDSLVYRHEPNQIRVQPGTHYRIEAFCRTTVLAHARARVTAYFADVDGRALPETVRHSELYAARAADEEWKKLSIDISAESPRAAFLVLELALLQPAMYAPQALGQRTLNVQDVRGSAWFDDVTVSQVPRVAMSTDRPGNVFRRGERARVRVRVEDRFTEDLAAQLVLRDADGRAIYQRSGALDMTSAETLGPGRKRMWIELPELPAGWYEAALVMSSQGQPLGSHSLAFVQLADDAPPARPDDRFGFIATSLPSESWPELPGLLEQLSAGRVKLAAWGGAADDRPWDSGAFDALLERLEELHITPTACLLDLPKPLADKLKSRGVMEWLSGGVEEGKTPPPELHSATPPLRHFTTSSLPLLLRADRADWQPQLAYLIARHANRVGRWQLGDDGTDAFVTDPAMRRAYALIYQEFAKLVRSPDLAMPWPAWHELSGELPATVALSIPSAIVLPTQIPLYMQDLKSDAPPSGGKPAVPQHLSISLNPLDRARYGRQAQVRDFAQRVIYALSADAKRIDLPLPFVVRREGGTTVCEPEELLLVARTLFTTLNDAAYRGKMPLADGVEAFLFERGGRGVVALWDRGGQSAVRDLALNLGVRPATIDLWGNVTPLTRRAADVVDGKDLAPGEVKVTVGPTPIFLVDIDGQMALTRASVAIDRPLIESSFQAHPRRIHFTSGYRQSVSGTLRLRPPAGWTLSPTTFPFTVNPGETFDKDVSIQIPYNSVAGPKTITAEFSIQGQTNATFTVPVTVNLGLNDLGMQTLALRDGNDVIVQQMVTNYGEQPIDYGAFALFPGQPRQERLIVALAPGKTVVKRYRFANVAAPAGLELSVGVKELVGTRILNDKVAIQ